MAKLQCNVRGYFTGILPGVNCQIIRQNNFLADILSVSLAVYEAMI